MASAKELAEQWAKEVMIEQREAVIQASKDTAALAGKGKSIDNFVIPPEKILQPSPKIL